MAAAQNPNGAGAQDKNLWAAIRDQVPNVLTTIVAAVGAVGFVSVVGGAITWNRFNSVELPADQAVAAQPQSELVATGVAALAIFLIVGAGAVVLVAQLEDRGPGHRRWALLTLIAVGMLYAISLVPEELLEEHWRLDIPVSHKLVLSLLIGLAWLLAIPLLGSRSAASAGKLKCWCVGAAKPDANWLQRRARWLCRLDKRNGKPGWSRRLLTTKPETATTRLMALLFLAEIAFAGAMWRLYDPWLGLTLLIGGVLGAICLLIADRDRTGFGDYGLAIFLSVIIFGGATQAMEARYRPRVQPAALLRVGDGQGAGICGLYVTENKDRVYLARLRPNGEQAATDSGRMFWFDRKKVVALSIGPLMSITDASARASELRAELVADSQPPASAHDTVIRWERFRKNGKRVIVRTRHLKTLPSRSGTDKAASTGDGTTPATPARADPELEQRLTEAQLSCRPLAAASEQASLTP